MTPAKNYVSAVTNRCDFKNIKLEPTRDYLWSMLAQMPNLCISLQMCARLWLDTGPGASLTRSRQAE